MGLGNQMFQYAAARSLSIKLQVPLKVDISSYKRYKVRKYELEEFFQISPDVATAEDLSAFNFTHPVRRYWNRLMPNYKLRALPYEEGLAARTAYGFYYLFKQPHKRQVYEERQFHFDKRFFNAQGNVYLKGYWMSYKYFQHCEEVIKQDFTIRPEKVSHLAAIAQEINNCMSVAVHIRCTDKKSGAYLKLYGEVTAAYYQAGIDLIKEKRGPVKLYVFSDDIEMAKEYILPSFDCTYISKYVTQNALEDFFLLTQCKNVIITNSTFSWWAAWLNKHSDKIVVAPKKWYNGSKFNYADIYYPGWIKL